MANYRSIVILNLRSRAPDKTPREFKCAQCYRVLNVNHAQSRAWNTFCILKVAGLGWQIQVGTNDANDNEITASSLGCRDNCNQFPRSESRFQEPACKRHLTSARAVAHCHIVERESAASRQSGNRVERQCGGSAQHRLGGGGWPAIVTVEQKARLEPCWRTARLESAHENPDSG
jgi:hypothetical protein